MTRMSRAIRTATMLAAGILLLGPAGPAGIAAQETEEDVEHLRLRPPAVVLDGVRRVAVLDFAVEGQFPRGINPGAQAAEQLTIALSDPLKTRRGFIDQLAEGARESIDVIGGAIGSLFGSGGNDRPEAQPLKASWARTNPFEVVASAAVQSAMRSLSGMEFSSIDAEEARRLSEHFSTDVMIAGKLTRLDDAQDAQVRQNNEVCWDREVSIRLTLSVVDAEGTLLGAPPAVEKRTSDRKCGASGRAQLRAEPDLLNQTLESLEDDLSNLVAPIFEEHELPLLRIEGPGADPARQAAEMAKDGDLHGAYATYWTLIEEDAYNPELSYNLGVLDEVIGNFEAAVERYAFAGELSPDTDRYEAALQRAQSLAGEIAVWDALGLSYQTVDWGVAGLQGELATGSQARTFGDREARHPVFDGSAGGDPVDEVPGGISVTVLGQEGERIRIQLPGNRQVWIERSNLVGG